MFAIEDKASRKDNMVKELLMACRNGSFTKLLRLLKENIVLYADDHQGASPKLRQLVGIGQCSRFLEDAVELEQGDSNFQLDYLHDHPAAVFYRPNQATPSAVMLIEEIDGRISKIFFLRRPEHIMSRVSNL